MGLHGREPFARRDGPFRRNRAAILGIIVKSATLEKCQETIGYRFKHPDLLALALTHASAASTRLKSNERLEFLGDSVLAMVVCHELYKRHEDLLEGEMTRVKSAVVSRRTCASIATALGLCPMIRLGRGMPAPTKLPGSVKAAVLEAVIGAVFLDGGLRAARSFVLKHVRPYIEQALRNEHGRNYKSLLQQVCQRRQNSTPEYRVLDEKGPDHSKCFEVGVQINGRCYPSAWGPSKKQAEQEAARRALIAMDELDPRAVSHVEDQG